MSTIDDLPDAPTLSPPDAVDLQRLGLINFDNHGCRDRRAKYSLLDVRPSPRPACF